MRAETKRRIIAGGLFLLPMGLVWITGSLLGGPNTVQGGPKPAIQMPEVVADPRPKAEPPTAEEQAAIAYAAQLRREAFGATPFYFTPREVEAPVIDLGPEAPDFVVQGILASSRGNTAIIDRKPYRVGEELGETGWIVTTIDVRSRSVTIQDTATGESLTQTVVRD